jgi:mRNA interferase MazF
LDFHPQSGHEQAGHRPALALSPLNYDERSGFALVCPITTRSKGNPLEIILSNGLGVEGVVLSDQVRSVDWVSPHAKYICHVPLGSVRAVVDKFRRLLR